MSSNNAGDKAPGNSDAAANHRFELLHETRKAYVAYRHDIAVLKDKHLLTLSAAALGLSVSYIDKIVQIDKAHFVAALILSWVLFGISLVSVVFSYHFSMPCYDECIRNVDCQLQGESGLGGTGARYERAVAIFNYIAMWAFVLGISLFIFFVIANIASASHV